MQGVTQVRVQDAFDDNHLEPLISAQSFDQAAAVAFPPMFRLDVDVLQGNGVDHGAAVRESGGRECVHPEVRGIVPAFAHPRVQPVAFIPHFLIGVADLARFVLR
jgi:hypothetical protein